MAVASISLLAVYGLAARVPTVVRAERFELVDPYGGVRAVLGQDKNHTSFKMADRSGVVRLWARAQDGLGEFDLYDAAGNASVGLESNDVVGGAWYAADSSGKARARLFIDELGARVLLLDRREIVRAMLQQDNSRGGLLEILNEKHETTASLPGN